MQAVKSVRFQLKGKVNKMINILVRLIKLAIKWAPKNIVMRVANYKLKGIADVKDYAVDLDAKTAYAHIHLYGEAESIEVWVENFGILIDKDSYKFILQQAKSNKPWLNNSFAFVLGKAWKIPVIPQLTPFMPLAYALLKIEIPAQKVTGYIEDSH